MQRREKRRLKTRIPLVVLSLALASIALAKGFYLSRLTEDEFQSKVSASPEIVLEGDESPPPLPLGAEVEVYYRKFNPLNPPSPREQFAVGEPSAPAWKPRRIAKITLYRHDHADAFALRDMKATAVAIGGIALINVEREPVLRKDSLEINSRDWTYQIMGYAYYADVVVKR